MTETISIFHPDALEKANAIIRAGGLIVFPTDTVYGVACDPWNELAIQMLYQAKQRPPDKAIPVLFGETAHLEKICINIPQKALQLAEIFWPGALTLLLPKRPELPAILSQFPSVGVRMPDYSPLLRLLIHTGPLAVTSANISGTGNLTSAADVLAQLSGRIDLLLDGGKTPGDMASTIVDCTQEQPFIIREGPISKENIYHHWNRNSK